jgi:hypothetical protein
MRTTLSAACVSNILPNQHSILFREFGQGMPPGKGVMAEEMRAHMHGNPVVRLGLILASLLESY